MTTISFRISHISEFSHEREPKLGSFQNRTHQNIKRLAEKCINVMNLPSYILLSSVL
jgi:hypothetical protein